MKWVEVTFEMMNKLKKIIPNQIKEFTAYLGYFLGYDKWRQFSWSQEGEDLILKRIFDHQRNGFYVDIGAHHPMRFSNTYLFYRRGWRGINIDAMPGTRNLFNKFRPRDINLEIGIGLDNVVLEYYVFNEPALNGFCTSLSEQRDRSDNQYKIIKTIPVQVMPLKEVLDKYLPKDQSIDFISVDVEGLDYDVLASNDWQVYRPKIVLAEILNSSLDEISSTQIGILMSSVGYKVFAKCFNTVFFAREDRF